MLGAEYLVRGATESNKEKQVGLANMTDDNLIGRQHFATPAAYSVRLSAIAPLVR